MYLDSPFLTLAPADVWGLFYNVEFLIGIGVIAAAGGVGETEELVVKVIFFHVAICRNDPSL